MLSSDFRRLVAVAIALTTTFITMPVSAADFTSARPVIGSVSAVGAVDLRGVGISQEGTLFSGDSIRSHEKGYAKVLLGTGSKIELYEKTDVSLNRDAQGVKIAMNTGSIGFTAKSPLRVDVMPFEVIASDDASGNVQIMSSTTAGVRALNGKVTVRNLKTSESFILMKGQQQLLGLPKGTHAAPLGDVASNVPVIPPVPQTPAGKTSNPGLAMDTGAWLAVIGGGVIAGIAIWAIVEAHNNNNDVSSLQSQVTGLNGQVTTLNTSLTSATTQLKTLQAAAVLASNLAAQQTALTQLTGNLTQALDTLQASGQGSTSQAAALRTSLSAANTQLLGVGNLQASIASCQASPSTCSTSTLSTNTTTQVGNTNGAINTGNSAVAGAKAINSNVTGGNVGTIPNPPAISASVPV